MYVGAIRTKNVGIRIPGIGAHSEFIAMQILSESIILSELTLFRIGIRHAIAMHGGMHRINATMTSIELKNFKSLAEIRNANHSHIGYWLLQFPYQYVSNYRLFSAVLSRHSFHWVADRGGLPRRLAADKPKDLNSGIRRRGLARFWFPQRRKGVPCGHAAIEPLIYCVTKFAP